MTIPETLLEIRQYLDVGYKPLIDYGEWRVAILRYIDELLPENISKMQRHEETDEVFVLLDGRCILFIGVGDGQITQIHAQDMEPLQLYNVKRSCWHTHTLSENATVLIIENRDTTNHNSPEIELNPEQKVKLLTLTNKLWK
jgi:ureidoglycolate hydrolase